MSVNYIDSQIKIKMATDYIDTPVAYDNQYFNTDGKDEWVRLSLVPNTPYSIGSKCYRETGLIAISVFVRRETETNEAYRIADVVGDIFKLQRFGDIVTGLPDVVRVGSNASDGNHWFQVNVFISYHYDTK